MAGKRGRPRLPPDDTKPWRRNNMREAENERNSGDGDEPRETGEYSNADIGVGESAETPTEKVVAPEEEQEDYNESERDSDEPTYEHVDCGYPITKKDKYCPACGEKLDWRGI